MKKYYIKDDDDQEYEVIETEVDEPAEEPVMDEGVEALSEEDIAALKMLASIADKLAALVSEDTPVDEPAEEPIEEEDVDEDIVEDADEEIEEEKEEEVIDTRKCDSKKSFGALEKRTKDSDTSLVDDVADAWAKRYGGK